MPESVLQVNVSRSNPSDRTSDIETSEVRVRQIGNDGASPSPSHADKVRSEYRIEIDAITRRADQANQALSPIGEVPVTGPRGEFQHHDDGTLHTKLTYNSSAGEREVAKAFLRNLDASVEFARERYSGLLRAAEADDLVDDRIQEAVKFADAEDVIRLVREAKGARKGDPKFTKAARAEKDFNERYGSSAFNFTAD